MTDITQLITAIAALVTAIGGAAAAIIVAIRSGNAQARVASSRSAGAAAVSEHQGDQQTTAAAFKSMEPSEMAAVLDLLGKIPGSGFNPPDQKDDGP